MGKPKYNDGKVYINDTQYFDNVPQIAWEFYIGGYQPAQKWLKDRKGRELQFDDILHYQKIIVALSETDWLMRESQHQRKGFPPAWEWLLRTTCHFLIMPIQKNGWRLRVTVRLSVVPA